MHVKRKREGKGQGGEGNRTTTGSVYNGKRGMEESSVNPVEGLREEPVPPPARSNILGALSWVRDLAFSILIAVVLIVFIYQPVKVEGTSMEPGLTDNERIFINKFTYKLKSGRCAAWRYGGFLVSERHHQVVYQAGSRPARRSHSHLARTSLCERRDAQRGVCRRCYRDLSTWADGKEVTVPTGEYFVLGDHRNSSSDSRAWGYVPRMNIYGKAVFVYWPLDKMGRVE